MMSFRHVLASVLAFALVFAPIAARADDNPAKSMLKKKKHKKKKAAPAPEEEKPAEEKPDQDEVKEKPGEDQREKPEKKQAEKKEEEEGGEEEIASPLLQYLPAIPTLSVHRYAYVGGGVLLLGAFAFSYSAQGQAKRADTITSARESEAMLGQARASAATANVLYGLATATIAYAVAMEFLPEPAAEKASLTFHF